MLYVPTKMLGRPQKVTKMLDNAYHTVAFLINFNANKNV